MSEKRSYKEVLASLETHIVYINTHLGNIDQHLNRLNERTSENEINTAKNSNNISLIWKVGGWVGGSLFGGGVITVILCRVLGVF